MKNVDLKRILYMNFLIQHKSTGNPAMFAEKIASSRSTLFEYLSYMRNELGVGILYDKFSETYYYNGKNLYAALGFNVKTY